MKKKITLSVIAVLLIITLVVGISYAYWKTTYVATNINKINSSCFSMELTNEKNNIVIESTYPITDEKGKTLTPYSFTITNTCDLFASYTINLEMLEGTTLNSKYIKTMINSEAIANLASLPTKDVTVEGGIESRELFKGSLGAGDSVDYTFRLWMDYDTPLTEESMNKNFQSKITVTSEVSTYSPVENGFTNLAEALLVNEYQTTSLDVAKNKINSKQEVDFSKTAPIIIWEELISTKTEELSINKAAPSTVGTYDIPEKAAKILLAKSYSFNSETGYYILENKAYYNPNDVDYQNEQYYVCNSNVVVNNNNSLTPWDASSCATLYKINNLSLVEDGTIKLSGGDSVATKRYTFNIYKMTETELESDKSDKGLYKSIDDFGDTYYYRGNVNNNIVKFAGYYWRVIRINGDGSIRLFYLGDSTNEDSKKFGIGTGKFNTIRTDPTYVGYMYSNTLGVSYEDTIRNDNDSAMKIKLEAWYKTYIIDKGYADYVMDSGFCNDRSFYSGNGYVTEQGTNYGATNRVGTFSPSYICPNPSNDLFTLTGNSEGNGKLTYPVGLITIDEIIHAGSLHGYLNKMVYTYSGQTYWTMSPYAYSSSTGTARLWGVAKDGSLGNVIASNYYGVRPVINLKPSTEITGGIGTANDPFIVK